MNAHIFQIIKTISALLGALLGFWLGWSFAGLFGFQTRLLFMLFALLAASLCSVLYVIVFYKLLQSKQATGQFNTQQLLLAALLVGLSAIALVFTLPHF